MSPPPPDVGVSYLAGVWWQLTVHGEGAPRDGVSIVGDVDSVLPLLCGGVTDQTDIRFTRLRLHFTGNRPLARTQLVTQTHTRNTHESTQTPKE